MSLFIFVFIKMDYKSIAKTLTDKFDVDFRTEEEINNWLDPEITTASRIYSKMMANKTQINEVIKDELERTNFWKFSDISDNKDFVKNAIKFALSDSNYSKLSDEYTKERKDKQEELRNDVYNKFLCEAKKSDKAYKWLNELLDLWKLNISQYKRFIKMANKSDNYWMLASNIENLIKTVWAEKTLAFINSIGIQETSKFIEERHIIGLVDFIEANDKAEKGFNNSLLDLKVITSFITQSWTKPAISFVQDTDIDSKTKFDFIENATPEIAWAFIKDIKMYYAIQLIRRSGWTQAWIFVKELWWEKASHFVEKNQKDIDKIVDLLFQRNEDDIKKSANYIRKNGKLPTKWWSLFS